MQTKIFHGTAKECDWMLRDHKNGAGPNLQAWGDAPSLVGDQYKDEWWYVEASAYAWDKEECQVSLYSRPVYDVMEPIKEGEPVTIRNFTQLCWQRKSQEVAGVAAVNFVTSDRAIIEDGKALLV